MLVRTLVDEGLPAGDKKCCFQPGALGSLQINRTRRKNCIFHIVVLENNVISTVLLQDSAMAASQNGFCSYKLSIHKKTNIMQIMTKNITFLLI